MATPTPGRVTHHAHRCSFAPDRQDSYLRLGTVTVFVSDQERSRKFYTEQLGFEVVMDNRPSSGDRSLVVTPADGTAALALVAAAPGSEAYGLIGRATQVAFLTEDVSGKFEEWSGRGVVFRQTPARQSSGEISAIFEDPDGNTFTLTSSESLVREIAEQRRAHAERFELERRTAQELESAREVQARLFPQSWPALATLECAGVCMQARVVGGDYYDFLDLGRERLGLVIGDVSGKGTAAALLMANLQAHLRNLCTTYSGRPFTPFAMEQPQRFLHTVNRLFYENTVESAFATLFFAEYDDSCRRLRYANCGHLPALVVRDSGEVERLDPTCTVIGVFKEWECQVGERQLCKGDTVVLYTDGITESFNDAGEEFGEVRLTEALRRQHRLASQALIRSVLDGVQQFSAQRQSDDLTLLVAKCK